MKAYDKNIFELSKAGRRGALLPSPAMDPEEALTMIPSRLLREAPPRLPEVSENQVVRHYTLLSTKNYGVDTGMYPLGSCTMKYNPKINETIASLTEFRDTHPYWPESHVQGNMELMHSLQGYLSALTGLPAVSLQPAAGSHGELTGLMIIKSYLQDHEGASKQVVLIPDSAHGTNPASVTMAGFQVREIPSNSRGTIDLEALKAMAGPEVAGLMLTNPNTLGLFEKDIRTIASIIHGCGGLLYYDGANMNANIGITRPGEMGFDIVHLNLHKTFSTPHGGGGPGSGPVAVAGYLADYLPGPVVSMEDARFIWHRPSRSIGRVKAFYGNFGVLARAYAYIRTMGLEGLREASGMAVLNANYMKEKLKEAYRLPYDLLCKHEFVLAGLKDPNGTSTLDIAKRLIDLGFHPPTIYFPLIVQQALMIEPTESESLEEIDSYVDALLQIAEEAKNDPDLLHNAPLTTPVRRLDEVMAARKPVVKHVFREEEGEGHGHE